MTGRMDGKETLISHPAEAGRDEMPLATHLDAVAERAADAVRGCETAVGEGDLSEVAYIIGLAHDFGKATPQFQRYIRDKPTDEPTHHARLGALIAYYALAENGFNRETRLAGSVAVAKHHGPVPNCPAFVRNAFEAPLLDARQSNSTVQAVGQIERIDETASEFARRRFDSLVGEDAWASFLDEVGSPPNSPLLETIVADAGAEVGFGGIVEVKEARFSETLYTDLVRLFGALTFADKTHAAGIPADDERLVGKRPELESLHDHLAALGGDEDRTIERQLNELRGAAQREIASRVESFIAADPRVGTITLPTGYGKTFAGLLAGCELQRRTGDRLVYALPFTSVIDQTADVLERVFDTDPTGNLLTVHHHLAETRTFSTDDEDDREAPGEVLLAESWRTGITLTTFVQLFESLAGPRNGNSLKLTSLKESVVILDEPQALPQYWWPLVRRFIQMLTEQFDATVLLMTATQPRLVEDSYELLPSQRLDTIEQDAFDGERPPPRVTYQLDETVFSTAASGCKAHETAADTIVEAVGSDDSVLAICNTLASTRTVTEELREAVPTVSVAELYDYLLSTSSGVTGDTEGNSPITSVPSEELAEAVSGAVRGTDAIAYLHLTTRVRPCDRRCLLRVASDLSERQIPFVMVSTQLVEAGVDISFDSVFRDFAPLDSVVQAAGRCNRSYERAPETGTTTVWQLEPPGEGTVTPSRAVYAPKRDVSETDLLVQTREVLMAVREEHGTVVDDRVLARDAVERYHETVGERVHSVAESNPLVAALKEADGERLRTASLIDRTESFELYVCRTPTEQEFAESLRPLAMQGRYDELSAQRDELAPIRVSIPVYEGDAKTRKALSRLEPLTNDESDPERILPAEQSIFDPEFGVQPGEGSVEDRFL